MVLSPALIVPSPVSIVPSPAHITPQPGIFDHSTPLPVNRFSNKLAPSVSNNS